MGAHGTILALTKPFSRRPVFRIILEIIQDISYIVYISAENEL